MAQDILIAPGSGEPFIDFMATGVPSAIKLSIVSGVIPASGTSELSFEGTQGQLFSIADNLSSGTIFSVSDVTGLPLIEADASGDVKIGEFGRRVGIGSGVEPAYQLDVFGTGNFHQGIRFSDGTTQTTGYATSVSTISDYGSGQATSLNNVSGVATSLVSTSGIAAYASGNTKNITFGSNAQGDILYHNGTSFVRLAKGTDNYVLTMNGNVPNWEAGSVPPGCVTTVKSNDSAVGDNDIVTIDFSSSFSVTEDPNTEVNIDLATVSVSKGGTNATSLDDKAVLITQDSGTDTVSAAVMDANGELLIGGTSGPAVATLTQGSNMTITNANGGITLASSGGAGVSDEDLKENVTDLNINALDKVDELRTVEFDWNQTASDEFNGISGHDMGLIAQEVENVFPEFISEFRGRKTVDYPKLSVILIKAAQELKQEVENLKQEIEQLKNSQ